MNHIGAEGHYPCLLGECLCEVNPISLELLGSYDQFGRKFAGAWQLCPLRQAEVNRVSAQAGGEGLAKSRAARKHDSRREMGDRSREFRNSAARKRCANWPDSPGSAKLAVPSAHS